jgi:hypothetical protein
MSEFLQTVQAAVIWLYYNSIPLATTILLWIQANRLLLKWITDAIPGDSDNVFVTKGRAFLIAFLKMNGVVLENVPNDDKIVVVPNPPVIQPLVTVDIPTPKHTPVSFPDLAPPVPLLAPHDYPLLRRIIKLRAGRLLADHKISDDEMDGIISYVHAQAQSQSKGGPIRNFIAWVIANPETVTTLIKLALVLFAAEQGVDTIRVEARDMHSAPKGGEV